MVTPNHPSLQWDNRITGVSLTIDGATLGPLPSPKLFTGQRVMTGSIEMDATARSALVRYAFKVWHRACRTIRRRDGATMFMADFGRVVFRIGYQTYPNGFGCDFGSVPTMKMARAALAQHLEHPWRVKGPQYRRLVIKEIRKLRLAAQNVY